MDDMFFYKKFKNKTDDELKKITLENGRLQKEVSAAKRILEERKNKPQESKREIKDIDNTRIIGVVLAIFSLIFVLMIVFSNDDNQDDGSQDNINVVETQENEKEENKLETSEPIAIETESIIIDSDESVEEISDINVEESDILSKIEVRFEKDSVDGNNLLLKVYVKNISDSIFTGDIHLFFYSVDGKSRLGQDMIIVEGLMPGQESWSNVTIDNYEGMPKLEMEFSNTTFEEMNSVPAEIDSEKTEKTTNSVRLNFDVASWYKDIKSIEVHIDGTCIVISSSTTDNSVIASSVWSCGTDYGVTSVQVVNENGQIKAVYP